MFTFSLLRKYFIGIHDAIGVENLLDALHVFDHWCRLRILQERRLLKSNAMLCADTAFCVFYEVHNKRFNNSSYTTL